MSRKRKPTGFLTRKKGTRKQKGQKFPIFSGQPFTSVSKKKPKLNVGLLLPAGRGPFARPKTLNAEQQRIKALKNLKTAVIKAKIIASSGINELSRAITVLEKETGILAPTAASRVFGARVHPSKIIEDEPLFIQVRQAALNARYAWNKARAAFRPQTKQMLADEGIREILDISVPKIREIRVRPTVVPEPLEEVELAEAQRKRALKEAMKKAKTMEERVKEIVGPIQRRLRREEKTRARETAEERLFKEEERFAREALGALEEEQPKERIKKWVERTREKVAEAKATVKQEVKQKAKELEKTLEKTS